MQHSKRNTANATQQMQRSRCNLAHATQKMHHSRCNTADATQQMQHSNCNTAHATQQMQHSKCNTANATQQIQHSIVIEIVKYKMKKKHCMPADRAHSGCKGLTNLGRSSEQLFRSSMRIASGTLFDIKKTNLVHIALWVTVPTLTCLTMHVANIVKKISTL